MQANLNHFLDDYQRAQNLFKTGYDHHGIGIGHQAAPLRHENAYYELAQRCKRAASIADRRRLGAGYVKAIARADIAAGQSRSPANSHRVGAAGRRAAPIDGNLLQVNVRPGQQVTSNETGAADGAWRHRRVARPGRRSTMRTTSRDSIAVGAAVAIERGSKQRTIPLRIPPASSRWSGPKKQLTGLNTERIDTRVLQVIYAVKPTDVPLFVGQQVDVYMQAEPPQPSGDGSTAARSAVSLVSP